MVYVVAAHVLPVAERDAINVLAHAPVLTLWQTAIYALVALTIALAVMFLALVQVLREYTMHSARSRRSSLWRRLSLDLVAATIGFVGYVLALYLASMQNLLSAQTQAQLSHH